MTNSKSTDFLRSTYFYLYPIVIVSGFFLRIYLGDVSLDQIQHSAKVLYIPCVFHWLTELDCPGCGMTRSMIAMYLWSPMWSFYFHPLGPLFAFLGAFYWLGMVYERVEDGFLWVARWFHRHSVSALLIVLAWGILRNF